MSTDDRLKALDALLLSVTDDNGMLLSEFDGLCAGVIVCPELIPPSEWMREVWGAGGTPQFASENELQEALNMVMGHYNEVARSLTPPEFEYGPVFERDTRTGDAIWERWVGGFERAMRLRMNAWERVIESDDEEARASVTMMLALHGIAQGHSELPEGSTEDLKIKAPDLITDMVIALNRWTKGVSQSDDLLQDVEPTGQSRAMRGTVASVAKRALKAGEMLDGEGGYTVWDKALPLSRAGKALPIGLAHGVRLKRDIAEGEVLALDDVDLAEDAITAMYAEAIAG